MATEPASGLKMSSITRRQVVFPAPLGPRSPKSSPFSMLKETSSTALTGPKDLAIWDSSTAGMGILLGIFNKLLELFTVSVESFAAIIGHAAKRERYLAAISLLYIYVTCL